VSAGTRSLLLAASFPPALGGVETLLYQTSRRLRQPPTVLAPVPAAAADLDVRRVTLSLVDRALYRPAWRLHPALHYTGAFLGPALRVARATRPAVIQAGHIYLAPLARLLARRLRVPFVVYAYGQEVWRGGRPMGVAPLDDALRGGALRAADVVLVPGTFTSTLLADWGVRPALQVAVPYGAEPLVQALAAPGPGEAGRLLSVARLVPRKGIDTVIRALPRVPAAVDYRVVGSGPDLARLRALAVQTGVSERVTFLGRVDEATLAAEYARCAAFVLTARRTQEGDLEGYGLVYFEAAASGRAVVAGRSGGEVDAVVDGETGVLVDGTSVPEVAAALNDLLGDPARAARLGVAGRRRVETTHNWDAAARVVDEVLQGLAGR
jgi:phosphatidylinositol alpha-1,6-mannosyltransferase